MESFPFERQPGVSRRLILEQAELEFIPKAVNVVIMGGETREFQARRIRGLQESCR